MLLGRPSAVSATGRLSDTGVDTFVSAQLRYDSGAVATIEASMLCCLSNDAVVCGTKGQVAVHRPFHAPEAITVTRQEDPADGLLLQAPSVTTRLPHDPPLPSAPGYNFIGSQGMVHEVRAVEQAIAGGLTEHPHMPLDDTLSVAWVMDEILRQVGVQYPPNPLLSEGCMRGAWGGAPCVGRAGFDVAHPLPQCPPALPKKIVQNCSTNSVVAVVTTPKAGCWVCSTLLRRDTKPHRCHSHWRFQKIGFVCVVSVVIHREQGARCALRSCKEIPVRGGCVCVCVCGFAPALPRHPSQPYRIFRSILSCHLRGPGAFQAHLRTLMRGVVPRGPVPRRAFKWEALYVSTREVT